MHGILKNWARRGDVRTAIHRIFPVDLWKSIDRNKLVRLCLALAVLTASRCFNPFAPSLEQNASPNVKITVQQSPEEVLQNFIYAYTFKDSLVYDNILDSAFVFVYFDPNLGTSGLFASWNRDVDLKTTGRLFRNFETLTLVWDSTIYEDLQAGSAELAKTLHLHLFGPQGEFNLTGNAVFNFRLSPWDGKWRITRWKDESQM
jgi:hypothetical protein